MARPTTSPSTSTATTSAVPVWAGRPIASAPVKGSLVAGAARAYRIRYIATGFTGAPTVVSGLVYIPTGRTPAGGWPVASWAHGTTGVADKCAPSRSLDAGGYGEYLSAWLAQGYAVAATDYEGLGTAGRHPYLIGVSEGRAVIDMVRAVHRLDRAVSNRWFAIGHSQGGQAALFAGALDASYGAGLDLRGTVAIAPPTQWRDWINNFQAFNPKAPANPFVAMILSGLNTVRPAQFRYADLLTPAGRRLINQIEHRACLDEISAAVAGKTAGQFFSVDGRESARITSAMVKLAEAPDSGYSKPVLLVQGGSDTLVVPAATRVTKRILKAKGTDVSLKWYDSADHIGVLAASLPDVSGWVGARMR